MADDSGHLDSSKRPPWWKAVGPALITACVVFGPGSLVISSKVGAHHGYELLWLLILTGVLMGTYTTMAARIGVTAGATPCQLVAARVGRPAAVILGLNLCLICTAFQFSNNIAVAAAADTLGIAKIFGDPAAMNEQTRGLINSGVLLVFNAAIITFIFALKQVYKALERIMKCMVALILVCFLVNLLLVKPDLLGLLRGLIPHLPEADNNDTATIAMIFLIGGLLGTTFSVGGAFYQGNLVREKGWTLKDYDYGFRDAVTGVCILTGVSTMIMMTGGTVLRGQPADDIGKLATQLQPLLGVTAHTLFCVGLLAVAMNPFVINAMIGGSILADGLGQPPRLSDPWPRRFTVMVLVFGMLVAMLVLNTPIKKVDAMVFGQAMTVIGNPLMAATLLWLANRRDVMGDRRNRITSNVLGVLGLLVVILMAILVCINLVLKFTAE